MRAERSAGSRPASSPAVHPHVSQPRQVGRRERRKSAKQRRRQRQAQRASHARQEQALGHELPGQPAAAGADRRAHGQLALPRDTPRQQQVRHVRAADEQDAADASHQHEQRRTDLRGDGVEEDLRAHLHRAALAEDRFGQRRPRHAARGAGSLGGGLGHRRSWAQPSQRREDLDRLPRRVGGSARDAQRRPQPRLAGGEIELGRRDADDGARPAVERERAADRGRLSAEALAPEAVRQHHDGLRAGSGVLGEQQPTRRGARADEREKRRRDRDARDARRLAAARLEKGAPPVGRQPVERARRAVAPGMEGEFAEQRPHRRVRAGVVLREAHQPVGVGIRQRAQQHAVGHREERRIGADAQRQRHERRDREPPLPRHRAQRLPDVSCEVVHVPPGEAASQGKEEPAIRFYVEGDSTGRARRASSFETEAVEARFVVY